MSWLHSTVISVTTLWCLQGVYRDSFVLQRRGVCRVCTVTHLCVILLLLHVCRDSKHRYSKQWCFQGVYHDSYGCEMTQFLYTSWLNSTAIRLAILCCWFMTHIWMGSCNTWISHGTHPENPQLCHANSGTLESWHTHGTGHVTHVWVTPHICAICGAHLWCLQGVRCDSYMYAITQFIRVLWRVLWLNSTAIHVANLWCFQGVCRESSECNRTLCIRELWLNSCVGSDSIVLFFAWQICVVFRVCAVNHPSITWPYLHKNSLFIRENMTLFTRELWIESLNSYVGRDSIWLNSHVDHDSIVTTHRTVLLSHDPHDSIHMWVVTQ